MIYYVNDVMNEDENNELAIATLELRKKYNGKKFNPEQYNNGKGSENRWLSGASSPQNSWNFTDIEYPDIVKTLSDRMSDAIAQISKGLNIWTIRSGKKTAMRREKGVYKFDMWIPAGGESGINGIESGFTRLGEEWI